MNYLQNHIYCHDSNWGGPYHCRHLVSLSSYEEKDKNDWRNVVSSKTEKVFSQEIYDRMKEAKSSFDDKILREYSTREISLVREDVIEWLNANVEDRTTSNGSLEKGWCIRSKESRANSSGLDMTFFFHRKRDAMAFIKRFSEYGKPTHYCHYFSDVRKTLDLETGEYVAD